MREKLMRFMQGRYGIDTFSKFLLIAGLVVVFFSSIFGGTVLGTICYLAGWVLIIYCYFRMISKNITKRYAENQTFLTRTYKIRSFFQSQKGIWGQRRTHHIYKCPVCSQKIRIPRGKGKIEIRCPKCSNTFVKKS
jgi:DNA-directed RNA polymerase subunit RPC12/RpoP